MELIEFKELPDESTPASVPNINHNFEYLNDKIDALANNLIVTENVSITNIAVNSKETVYKTFTMPSKAGYTPIAITPNNISGGGSGYAIYSASLEGYITVYNGWVSNGTFSITLKIIYLKN